jgi:hypothetical protein
MSQFQEVIGEEHFHKWWVGMDFEIWLLWSV